MVIMKTGKRIPIVDAKNIGVKNGYNQVIIVGWDSKTNTTSVCTWGKSLKDCEQAADGGNCVKKALGFPEDKYNDKPTRIKNKLLKTYMLGFNNELYGKDNIKYDNKLTQRAYDLGRGDAIIGDDISSIDRQSDDEILKRIKNK